jgi:hypothetical protein
MLYTILVVVIILALLGAIPLGGRGPYYGTGWYGGGAVWTILIVLVILALLGRV